MDIYIVTMLGTDGNEDRAIAVVSTLKSAGNYIDTPNFDIQIMKFELDTYKDGVDVTQEAYAAAHESEINSIEQKLSQEDEEQFIKDILGDN